MRALRVEINKKTVRGAWNKGVQAYANMIIDTIERYESIPRDITELELFALNGARDWKQASEGGSYLIYDTDIAELLCNPTELKQTAGGLKAPNNKESWIDVQARALYQAFELIKEAYKKEVA